MPRRLDNALVPVQGVQQRLQLTQIGEYKDVHTSKVAANLCYLTLEPESKRLHEHELLLFGSSMGLKAVQ